MNQKGQASKSARPVASSSAEEGHSSQPKKQKLVRLSNNEQQDDLISSNYDVQLMQEFKSTCALTVVHV